MSDRPRVTVHYAQTVDGRIATRSGHSRWISSEETLRLAHSLRASHDAVLVGVGTVLADDPQLTVRLVPGTSPIRVVVDSALRMPRSAALLRTIPPPTWIATVAGTDSKAGDLTAAGAEILVVQPDQQGRVSLSALLARLSERGVSSLLVEGGASVITAFLQAGLVDRLVVCIAPKVVGRGIEAVGNLGIDDMGCALRIGEHRWTVMGPDVVLDGKICDGEPDG